MFYKTYFKYTIPSMISFTLTGIYVIIDGFFIGQKVGYLALAAANIAWPIAALTYAIGAGLGMGGSVVSSLRRGEGKEEESREAIGCSMTLILISSLIVMLLMYTLASPLTKLIGADAGTHELATIYLQTLALGAVAQIGYCGLLPIVRSLGHPVLAMVAVVAGNVLNIFLDWLFVWEFGWGIRGAALATIFGEYLTVIPLAVFFLMRNNRIPARCFKIQKAVLAHIARIGVSPFGLSMLPSLSIIIMNIQIVRHGGDTALAAYAILGYVLTIIQQMNQGFSEGAQPLLSYNTGAGDRALVRKTARLTYIINISLGTAGGILVLLFIRQIGYMYNAGPEVTAIMAQAMPFFAATMPLFGFTRTTADFLYAVDRAGSASLFVYLEGLILTPGLEILLPGLMGLTGVWLSPLAAQLILLALGLYLLFKKPKPREAGSRGSGL